MVKLFSQYFPKSTLLLVVTECTLLCAAFIGAAFLHFGAGARAMFTIEGCLKVGAIAAICLSCLYYSDLYAPLVVGSARAAHSRLIQGLGVACLVMAAVVCVLPSIQFFRGFTVTGMVIAAILLVFYRPVFLNLNKSVQLVEATLIMGEGCLAASLAKVIHDRPDLGLCLVGYIGKEPNEGATGNRRDGRSTE
jgi:FlaA1/EpsC-like NDP-sugar epimerase